MALTARQPAAWLAGMVLGCLLATVARAEDLMVAVDHALLLRLDQDADIVHIANPAIADVALESPRLIFVVGLAPGQTGIYVLDRDGNEMLAGSVLVTESSSNEVTLNRNVEQITYACASRCTEVSVTGQASAGAFDTGSGTGGETDFELPE
jgi:Flp pilus assembly secretin CpaC